jgi:hypothetical protein
MVLVRNGVFGIDILGLRRANCHDRVGCDAISPTWIISISSWLIYCEQHLSLLGWHAGCCKNNLQRLLIGWFIGTLCERRVGIEGWGRISLKCECELGFAFRRRKNRKGIAQIRPGLNARVQTPASIDYA